jgi:hypothetical protein
VLAKHFKNSGPFVFDQRINGLVKKLRLEKERDIDAALKVVETFPINEGIEEKKEKEEKVEVEVEVVKEVEEKEIIIEKETFVFELEDVKEDKEDEVEET